jgi:hypothetical protein
MIIYECFTTCLFHFDFGRSESKVRGKVPRVTKLPIEDLEKVAKEAQKVGPKQK